MSKKFCNLYNFVKDHNKGLISVIDDLCAEGLFKGRGTKTFLNPSSSMINQLQKMIDKGESDEALVKLKSLFLEGYHENVLPSMAYVSFNRKSVKNLKAKSSSKFNKWNSEINVFDIDSFPEEGETVKQNKDAKGEKSKRGGSEKVLATRIEITNDLLKKYKGDKDFKVYAYAVNSLLTYIKNKDKDEKTYKSICKLLDPNMIISWYILVQPSAKHDNKHIPDVLFSNWAKECYNAPIPSVKLIRELFSTNCWDNKELNHIVEKKKQISGIGLKQTIEEVVSAYNNDYCKLLEDELRFRLSDIMEFDSEDLMTLNLINWDEPQKNLVLFNKIPTCNLLQSEIFKLIQQFIKSNSFLYTPFNPDIVEKIRNRISGAGNGSSNSLYICGGAHRDNIQNMHGSGLGFSLEAFIGGLTAEQKDELKSYL